LLSPKVDLLPVFSSYRLSIVLPVASTMTVMLDHVVW
jgi:hypothetical protein